MPDVKKKSPLRAQQAAQTRERILRAAGEVFAEQGFVGARVEDVATRAGVAVPTVYKTFGNKPNLLTGALEVALTGGSDAPITEQPWWTEQLEEADPARQLDLIARNARQMYDRAGPILEAMRSASAHHDEVAAAWQRIQEDRLARGNRSAKRFVAKAGLPPGMTTADVALTLMVLTQPELYTSYRTTGRTADQYEAWLARVLRSTLLSS